MIGYPYGTNLPNNCTICSSFQQSLKQDAQEQLRMELYRLVQTESDQFKRERLTKEFEEFRILFDRYLKDKDPLDWSKVENAPDECIGKFSYQNNTLVLIKLQKTENFFSILQYNQMLKNLPSLSDPREILNKLIVVKLNGGLGTSMGCTGPKSLIDVRSGMTFLDMTVQQIEVLNSKYGCNVPLVLMNSFNTASDTEQILRKYQHNNVKIKVFNQHRFPRLNKETLAPVAKNSEEPHEAWYPGGHGDIYKAFYNSGLMDEFIDEGKEFMFLSNIDNLGATVDLNLLNMMANGNHEIIMEVRFKNKSQEIFFQFFLTLGY